MSPLSHDDSLPLALGTGNEPARTVPSYAVGQTDCGRPTGRSTPLSGWRYHGLMTVQFTAVFRPVPGGYVAYVEELPGANTQGATLDEARANLEEAVTLVLEANRTLVREETAGSQRHPGNPSSSLRETHRPDSSPRISRMPPASRGRVADWLPSRVTHAALRPGSGRPERRRGAGKPRRLRIRFRSAVTGLRYSRVSRPHALRRGIGCSAPRFPGSQRGVLHTARAPARPAPDVAATAPFPPPRHVRDARRTSSRPSTSLRDDPERSRRVALRKTPNHPPATALSGMLRSRPTRSPSRHPPGTLPATNLPRCSYRGITWGMKVALSIPNELFDSAETLTKQLGVSRSRLYATALRRVRRQAPGTKDDRTPERGLRGRERPVESRPAAPAGSFCLREPSW